MCITKVILNSKSTNYFVGSVVITNNKESEGAEENSVEKPASSPEGLVQNSKTIPPNVRKKMKQKRISLFTIIILQHILLNLEPVKGTIFAIIIKFRKFL